MSDANLRFRMTLILSLISCGASAEAIQPYSCRNGYFPEKQDALALYRVTGTQAQKLYFYNDDEGCPDDESRCRSKSYVIPGDELLINQRVGNWACAWFNGKSHETVGWVKTDQLTPLPKETLGTSSWVGRWGMYKWDGGINITRRGEALQVDGKATWTGGRNGAGERVVHYGDIGGQMKPVDGRARLIAKEQDSDLACEAKFTRIGKFLVVKDNQHCGGMNVSFSGVYTKK